MKRALVKSTSIATSTYTIMFWNVTIEVSY